MFFFISRLFEEHPKYLEYFDFSQDDSAEELRENKSLHAHALNVMHLIGKKCYRYQNFETLNSHKLKQFSFKVP